MSNPIEAKVQFPFWQAYRANLQIIRFAPFNLLLSLLFPLAGVYLIYLLVIHHHIPSLKDGITILLAFLFTPITSLISLFVIRRKNKLAEGPFIYAFDAEGIHIRGEAFNSTIKWLAIPRVVITKNFIFLFIAPSRAHCVPVSDLEMASCLNEVIELVSANVKNTKRV